MKSLNEVTLLGYAGKDSEVRYTAGGKAVANFTLATTERWGDDNERQENTSWHKIVCWEGLAQIANQLVKKGSPVLVRGKIAYREYKTNAGDKRMVVEIVAHDLILLPHVARTQPAGEPVAACAGR